MFAGDNLHAQRSSECTFLARVDGLLNVGGHLRSHDGQFLFSRGVIPQLSHERKPEPDGSMCLITEHPDTLTKMRKGHACSIKRARKSGVKCGACAIVKSLQRMPN